MQLSISLYIGSYRTFYIMNFYAVFLIGLLPSITICYTGVAIPVFPESSDANHP